MVLKIRARGARWSPLLPLQKKQALRSKKVKWEKAILSRYYAVVDGKRALSEITPFFTRGVIARMVAEDLMDFNKHLSKDELRKRLLSVGATEDLARKASQDVWFARKNRVKTISR